MVPKWVLAILGAELCRVAASQGRTVSPYMYAIGWAPAALLLFFIILPKAIDNPGYIRP